MKKIIFCVMAIFLSMTFLPIQANAADKAPASSLAYPKPVESPEVKAMELRLNEIKAMDKSNMKASEKRALRKEVKSMNHKLREVTGGVYVSVGVIILVVVLLIILL
jgi:hypothetical protein